MHSKVSKHVNAMSHVSIKLCKYVLYFCAMNYIPGYREHNLLEQEYKQYAMRS